MDVRHTFSSCFLWSTCDLTTLRAKICPVLFNVPSKHTANPPFPSLRPVWYTSGLCPGSTTTEAGRHLSSILSLLTFFPSGFGLGSFLVFVMMTRDRDGKFADRGERASIVRQCIMLSNPDCLVLTKATSTIIQFPTENEFKLEGKLW